MATVLRGATGCRRAHREPTVYDEHAAFYLDFVDAGLAAEPSLLRVALDAALARLQPGGCRVLDLACGEGHVGSHHRMLSTYVNDLLDAGFRLTGVDEPVMPPGGGLFSAVPRLVVLASTRD